ncbi:Nucleotide-binding protein, UspA family [Halalkaliarchaeum sp. AArc-CO]|uniref:universal stress protein n=1 Tax=unclassified Halalkaliarchaeum TaxID=2678344 RepID=UPI00217EFC37|nr:MULTISPECIES: universal stress protein [unclassified Halalkaliarchaeum]MDR5673952.1 universal stress protein [Halalkaliarchaeum sp. AArc-GB]UWG50588.1 Nucleotide-binding protein, UspA family [Halalkaliarchaeum sp. AArc-CO]
MYSCILIPTDGSTEVERAVEHALDLAEAHGATVHALYVVNTASYAGLPMETAWEGVDELLRSDAEAAVETVRERAQARSIPVETSIVEGTPSRCIVREAEERGCDLIVMGTHGRGGIDRLLLGSVAEKVVRASALPVLTVSVAPPEDDAVVESQPAESRPSDVEADQSS